MNYDVAIIGSGWAGFNAALKAKSLGLKVCLIEKSQLGGTCLNKGCIPTKALIQSSKVYSLSKKSAIFGINSENTRFDYKKIQERKEKIIQQLRQGMQAMLKGIDFFNGEANLVSNNEIKIGSQSLKTNYIVIASGSKPTELTDFKFDKKKIISSDELLQIESVPSSLLIVGGGVIGCEFASLFSSLGSKVTVVELLPQLIPGADLEIAKKLEIIFKKKNIKVNTNTDAKSLSLDGFDLILVCVGRSANSQILGLEKIGVKLDKGKILVDEFLKTNIDNIFAAGDCTGKYMLAHYAAYQGCIAAENIASGLSLNKADNKNVPSCIFTDPEIAFIGLSEQEAVSRGLEIKVNKFDFLASGMARILDETEGFIKVISEKNNEEILGASIIGPKATELISIFGLAISNKLKLSHIRSTIFAHPSLSESIHEVVK